MKNSKIAELRAQANNTASVNTNTENNMSNIKSVEIAVNLIMSANGASEGFFDKVQGSSKGKTLVKGRSVSRISVKGEDQSIFASFLPLPKQRVCKYNRNNTAVVIATMGNGSTQILNATQTEVFWANVLDLPEDVNATTVPFSVICDIPEYSSDEANEMLRANEARSVRIKFDGMPQFATSENPKTGALVLRPVNASADFSSATVGDDPNVIHYTNKYDVLTAKGNSTAKFDATKYTKSAKLREERKAQAEAARASVENQFDMNFDPKPEAEETSATPVVETAVVAVDAEKEALRVENAELKAQVAELSANVASLTAMMQQFMATQSQPVVATPVVEQTPKPEVVEEEPAVEETVEEAPKAAAPKPGSREWLAARRAAASTEKAAKASGKLSEEDFMIDFE